MTKNKHIKVREFVKPEDYKRTLVDCDLLLIPANFDQKSITYTRYSMANKLPECLASGTPILAYGTDEISTISYIIENNLAYSVTEKDIDKLSGMLKHIINHDDERHALSKAAKRFVSENHEAGIIRENFARMITACVKNK